MVARIGLFFLSFLTIFEGFGKFILFQVAIFPLLFRKVRWKLVLREISIIGIGTMGVILLTSFFTGMVSAIQLYSGFHQFGIESFMGYTIFLSIAKELGPVFGSLMVISRAVSSMAAEIGTMRVTEQIDAIETLAVDSRELLIVPKILASVISLPLLVIIFDFVGNFSAFLIANFVLGINPITYQNVILQHLEFTDIYSGIIKAFIFGYLISAIGTYVGYMTTGGAKGVGQSTTKAVVYAAVCVFMFNYLISSLFLMLGW